MIKTLAMLFSNFIAMKLLALTIVSLLFSASVSAQVLNSNAQGEATEKINTERANPLTFSGYAEVYYGFDFSNPDNNRRPSFVVSHNRHNEVNINLAYLKAGYSTRKVRANLALATGTYMNANYVAEQGVLKNILEGNVGIKLSRRNNLWLDAGIMPSHIGFESAVSKDCPTLTRSIIADNSPYYEAGVKLSYSSRNERWYLAGLLLNGWQRIQRPDGNTGISGGAQVLFKPSGKLSFSYSNFVGSDMPDIIRRIRFFQSIYAIIAINNKIGITCGIDYGIEQKHKNSVAWNNWFGAVFIVQYRPSKKIALAFRGERYEDKSGVIISRKAFTTSGHSLNFDYWIRKNVLWRVEGKVYNSENPVYLNINGSATKVNIATATSIAISF